MCSGAATRRTLATSRRSISSGAMWTEPEASTEPTQASSEAVGS